MGKTRVVIYILSFLLLVSLTLSIVGFLNRNNNTNNNQPNNQSENNNDNDNQESQNKPIINNVNISETKFEIEDLNSFLSSFDFVKSNKENKSKRVLAKIEEGQIYVEIEKESVDDSQETNPDPTVILIDHITNPECVLVKMSNEDENIIKLYVLDSKQSVYFINLNMNPSSPMGMETYEYKVPNASSIAISNVPLANNRTSHYVIIKTTDNKYYTDYKFSEDGIVLTELIEKVNQ